MKATQKYITISPRKLRLVADAIRHLSPQQALIYLRFLNKRAALPLRKAIQSALANAKQQGVAVNKLVFEVIDIQEGPTLKRWRPVSRGMAHSIFKRTSHIFIKLKEQNGTKS